MKNEEPFENGPHHRYVTGSAISRLTAAPHVSFCQVRCCCACRYRRVVFATATATTAVAADDDDDDGAVPAAAAAAAESEAKYLLLLETVTQVLNDDTL